MLKKIIISFVLISVFGIFTIFFCNKIVEENAKIYPLDFKNDKWQKHWGRFNRYEKLAWYWQKTNSVIFNDLENLGPNKSIMLKYENIFHKNKLIKTESFEKINQFLNIEISDNLISNKKLNSQNADIFNQDEFNESLNSINEIIKDVKNVLKY